MPIARFQLPDGRVARFEVPDGTTPEQAQSMMAQHFSADNTKAMDPTAGNSFIDNAMAATGKGMTSVARALGASPEWLRKQGLPGTKEEAEQLDAPLMKTTGGKVGNVLGTAALAAPLALIPGANTYAGAATIGAVTGGAFTEGDAQERLKGAAFGGAGGLGGKAVGDALGWAVPKAVRALSGGRATAQAANAQKDAAAVAAREAGYVIPPADVNPRAINELLGGLSGKIKTAQVASAKNQAVTNNLVRKELGIAGDSPLTVDTLAAIRKEAATSGYAPVRAAGEITATPSYTTALDDIVKQYQGASRSFPGAVKNEVEDMVKNLRQTKFDSSDAVDMVRVLRDQADSAYRSGNKSLGKASKEAAGAIEDQLDQHLQGVGQPGALDAFRKARQTIAKTYSAEKALNSQTGDISADALAKQLAKGRALSGELEKVAKVSQAFPKATQTLKEAPKAVSPLDFMAALLGAGSTGPVGALAIGARPAVRSLLLSKGYQGLLGGPQSYAPGLLEKSLPLMANSQLRRGLPIAGGLLSADLAQ